MAGAETGGESSLSDDIQSEIEALRGIYSADGEFSLEMLSCHGDDPTKSSHVCEVTVKPADMALGIAFSLPASYPETTPRIGLVSIPDSMSEEQIGQLLVHLYQEAKEHAGMPVMFSLVEAAKEWLLAHEEEEEEEDEELEGGAPAGEENDDDGDWNAETEESEQKNQQKKKQPKKQKHKQQQDDDQKFGRQKKKPPMKTASDVISRIQWDDQLNAEHFIVGYLDRFIGVIEQPFTSFYWEDISGVDARTLAIPRHRVQYFKYKDEVVWDKTQRLDNVFGSLGSGLTVVDVIERYGKENISEESGEEKEEREMEELELEVEGGGDEESGACADAGKAKPQRRRVNKSRPNYFIGIQITSEEVKKNVQQVHDHMTSLDPLVSSYLISPAHFHVTLCMLQLTTEAQINTALSVLKSVQPELAAALRPVTLLRFVGLGSFHDRIVYVSPQADPGLAKMTGILQSALKRAGVSLNGTREEFVPHLTIMKMPREEASGHPIFTSDLGSKFADIHFGTEDVSAVHLCSITEKPSPDRFYYSLARVDLTE